MFKGLVNIPCSSSASSIPRSTVWSDQSRLQTANVYIGSHSLKVENVDKKVTLSNLFRCVMILALRVLQQLSGCVYDVPYHWTLARHSNIRASASLTPEGWLFEIP